MSEQAPQTYPRLPLARFNKLINLTMSRLFASYGHNITREQEVILRELHRLDGVNQVDLAFRTGQDRNNLSRTLALLENKGLIHRDVCHLDKRNTRVFISDEGRALHAKAYRVIDEYRRILFKDFTQQEIDDFSETIQRLIRNLADFVGQETPAQNAKPNPCRKLVGAKQRSRKAAPHPTTEA